MRHALIIAVALLIPASLIAPVLLAQEVEPWEPPLQNESPPSADDDGTALIGRGLGMLMENFMRDVGPELGQIGEDMSGALSGMAPVLKDLAVLVDDLGNYEAPERLKNGDVIIRRKADAPPPPPLGDGLGQFGAPGPSPEQEPSVPIDPYAPEIEL